MKSNFLIEILISLILLIFLVLLINPFNFLMPKPMEMMLVVGLALIFIIFIGFFWREKVVDERESLHRYISGRFAYFTGVSILTLGVIIQSLSHNLDKWLIFTLIAVIIAKIVGLFYGRFKQ